MKVHFREQYGTKGEEYLYVTPIDQDNTIVRVTINGTKPAIAAKSFFLIKLFKKIFLPQGYPDSVSSDYLDYQKWDTLQAFASTITTCLATHSVLKGLGVGDAQSTPLSATYTWILKEGAGHFGRILFAYWKGTELDINSKKWRLRADIINDVAMMIELFILPFYTEYALYVLCLTTMMKAIVGIAGGATRNAMTIHHAVRNNLADVAAKDSAQETCVNLIGSFIGLLILSTVTSTKGVVFVFIITIAIHLYANVRAVKSVCLRTFNEARYLIVLEEYFRHGTVLPPQLINNMERVTVGQTVSLTAKVKIGCSVKDLCDQMKNRMEIEDLIACFETRDRFLIAETRNSMNAPYVGIFLHFDVKPHEILRAYFFVASYLQDRCQIKENYFEVQAKWSEFLNLAQIAGYNVNSHLLDVDEFRCDWRFI